MNTWNPVSDRLLKARLSHRYGHLFIIVAFAPTDVADYTDKDCFYNPLIVVAQSVPPNSILLILGDLNAVTRTVSDHRVTGPYRSGSPNNKTARLLSFSAALGLTIVGTWYQRLNIYRWTWISNDCHTHKEIDHILGRYRDRGIFASYRVFEQNNRRIRTTNMFVLVSSLE